MIRRNTRLRKEYLYRRSLIGKEKEEYEKKKKLQEALKEGKAIPTELREIAATLERQVDLENIKTLRPPNYLDDEYFSAQFEDPKVMVTTSRDPSSRLIQFSKEIRYIFPNSHRLNRGNHIIRELVDASRRHGITDLVIVHETRGRPDGLVVSHLPYGPTAYFSLWNVVMRHEVEGIEAMSTAAPHLIFNGFSTELGKRVTNILKYLFPPAKEDSKRVLTFANQDDWISFRHHTWTKTGHNAVELHEVGPRFELQLYKIRLGTIEMEDAENEWVLRTYQNTTKKKNFL
uniref:Brix domain-containing protein n=1 Tax=Arcella intermedia TaxID=1963864 RepID=A0A6B2LCC0_9EUKA